MMYCYASKLEIILKHKIIPFRFQKLASKSQITQQCVLSLATNPSCNIWEFFFKKFWNSFQILSNFVIFVVII